LQLADSAFPTGAFTCSQGMETLVQAGWVHDRTSAEAAIREGLAGSVGSLELPAVCVAYGAARAGQWDRIRTLHAWLDAAAHAREAREASRKIGRRMLASTMVMTGPSSEVEALLTGDGLHQPLALGVAACMLGVDAEAAVTAAAWSYCAGQLSAAARLVPLGQHDVLLAHATLRPLAAHAAATAMDARAALVQSASTPIADIARMRHERQRQRLFGS